jgi:hypothetical protein
MPQSGMAERGRRIFAANGCFYCHSQQLRPDYIASDLDRTRDFNKNQKWGVRRSAPRDYVFDRPVLLGKERNGPDLANIGKSSGEDQTAAGPGASPAASPAQAAAAGSSVAAASPATGSPSPVVSPAAAGAAAAPSASPVTSAAAASPPASVAPAQNAQTGSLPAAGSAVPETKPGEQPPYSAAWHHQHLYAPRSINQDSNMPAYRFLYQKRRITGEPSLDALKLIGRDAPPENWEIIPTYDAKCLVAFLMSRDQSHPLKEVKSASSSSPAPPAAKGAAK